MGQFNESVRTMVHAGEAEEQAAATASAGTWYEVMNYSSGPGILFGLRLYSDAGGIQVRFTIDGGAAEIWENYTHLYGAFLLPIRIEFLSSCLVEIANNEATPQKIGCRLSYGKIS